MHLKSTDFVADVSMQLLEKQQKICELILLQVNIMS